MKLIAELNSEKHAVEFKRDGEKISASVDGREYALEASEVEPDVYILKHENQIFQIYVLPGEPAVATLGNHSFEIKISDPKRLRSAGSAAGSADGTIEIKTAMPGKVVRILAEQGAEIKQGESVLVVEAMKMQNEMKSPKDGTVKEIRVAEGATVNAGDILAVIE